MKEQRSADYSQKQTQQQGGQNDAVRAYLQEIGGTPLLAADEEIKLGRWISEGHEAQKLIEEDSAATPAEFQAQLRQFALGFRARRQLVQANLRLAWNCARFYSTRTGIDILELAQEANCGLIRAADRFDYRRGYRFSTYATWWIRQAIIRYLNDCTRTIRLPVHVVEANNRLNACAQHLVQELGREPSAAELARDLAMPLDKVQALLNTNQTPVTLDAPVGLEEEAPLSEHIEDEAASDLAIDMVNERSLREDVARVLNTLPERERMVVAHRFGLQGPQQTLAKLGKLAGMSRERVRQIEAEALERLRQSPEAQKLVEYLH